ncbi:DUF4199 domain-containing protein [Spongiivirga sp. MCCC 1A20706]|uniref:DUF4199 domain-containing protein n=1 Tax=Spongiivirga sp. MCCC 1A20706 TaxID=3160963 RepID=UPI0039773DBD
MLKEAGSSVRYALFIFAGLVAYFLILRLVGLHENPWLRLFNGVIVSFGIYSSIRFYKADQDEDFSYGGGFKTGLLTGFIATVLFVVFMAIYMYHIDPAFVDALLDYWKSSYAQGPGILIAILIIEGFASSVVLTLAFMQLFKKSRNITQTT